MVSFIWKMQIKISLRFCLTLVFQGNLCEGNSGACLSTDQLPQPGLSLDGAVGDPHHETQGRQEDHQLNGAHVKGNRHQVSLLVLHQGGDCFDPCWKDRRSFVRQFSFACSFLLWPGQAREGPLPLLRCLWPVLVGKRKQLGSCLPAQGRGELVNGRRYFQPLKEDGTLLLQLNEAGPFDKAREISLGLDVQPNAGTLRLFLREFTILLTSCFLTMVSTEVTFFPLAVSFQPLAQAGGEAVC